MTDSVRPGRAGESDLRTVLAELQAQGPDTREAEVPVSHHAIRTWCAAIGDDNPTYIPARAVAPGGRGDRSVAPPPMLQTWTMPIGERARDASPTLHSRVRGLAAASGFDAVVATDYEMEFDAPVRPGDVLTERSWVHSVSPRKATGLGEGHFVTIAFEISNQRRQGVGGLRVRTLYFHPGAAARSSSRSSPAPAEDESAALPPLKVPLTRSLVIAASLASNDHEPVHHDHEIARAQGLDDIILSIVTTAGLVGRYVAMSSPGATLRRLGLRLARPAYPGDTLVLSGDLEPTATGQRLLVVGRVGRGMHVQATADVEPPASTATADQYDVDAHESG